jgi:uroporphyrinogen-III synthase
MRLLVTRPEPDNARTAAALRARGHSALLAPLLVVAPVADAEIGGGPFAGLVLTSANGARALAVHARVRELSALPVFAVGRRTAQAARDAGCKDVVSADGDVDDLATLISARIGTAGPPLLYLAGEDRTGDLEGTLTARGIAVLTVVAYRAVTVVEFPSEAAAAIRRGAIDGVLHFSRRSAAAYVARAKRGDLLAAALAGIHFCLSERVAEPLKMAGAGTIRVAQRPDEASLLALVE